MANLNYSALSHERTVPQVEVRRTIDILSYEPSLINHAFNQKGLYQPTAGLAKDDMLAATRLRLFAADNGLTFFGNVGGKHPDPESVFSSNSILGNFRAIPHGLIMPSPNGGWLEIGQLVYISDSREPEQTFNKMIYIKTDFGVELPSFSLDAINSALRPSRTIHRQVYATESNEFNRLFKLYIPGKDPAAVLKVLNPKVMAVLIDYFRGVDIDIHSSGIFCLTPGEDLDDEETLKSCIDAIELLADVFRPAKPVLAAPKQPHSIEEYMQKYGYINESVATIRRKARNQALKNTAVAAVVALIVMVFAVIATLVVTN